MHPTKNQQSTLTQSTVIMQTTARVAFRARKKAPPAPPPTETTDSRPITTGANLDEGPLSCTCFLNSCLVVRVDLV